MEVLLPLSLVVSPFKKVTKEIKGQRPFTKLRLPKEKAYGFSVLFWFFVVLTHANRKVVVSKTCHWHLFEDGVFKATTRNLFYLKKVPSFIRLAPYKLPSKKRFVE